MTTAMLHLLMSANGPSRTRRPSAFVSLIGGIAAASGHSLGGVFGGK